MTERRTSEDSETEAAPSTVVERKTRPSGAQPRDSVERSTSGLGSTGTSATGAGTAASRITSATFTSPDDTLWEQEIARMRIFLLVIIAIGVFMIAWIGLIVVDPLGRTIAWGAIAFVIVPTAAMLIAMRDPKAYTEARITALALACVVGTTAIVYVFGVYSPAVITTLFGVIFYAPSRSRIGTLAVCVAAGLLYAALAAAVGMGLFPDLGVVSTAGLGWLEQVTIVVAVESFYVSSYFLGRASREVTLRALIERDKAARALAQREALLVEARQELEEALRAGGLGRYTDQELGSFRLGAILGRGGMGDVYEAVHRETGERAAVKLMHARALGDSDLVRRFIREATIVASLDVPQVVKVIEVGGLDAALPYIAMERLVGSDLADVLRNERRVSLKHVVRLVRDVAKGLEAALARGIVHRDIKPRNLFHAEQPDGSRVWKILDFGVSKLASHNATLTAGNVVGTPGYMAPEQALGGDVTHQTDVFALGVVAFRALTGRPPFSGDSSPEILYAVTHQQPPRPGSIVSIPDDVDRVLALALAKEAPDRIATARELADMLRDAARGHLSDTLRERADRLLAEKPWGSRV